MKNTDIFAAIGNIDDRLIERSYNSMNRSRRRMVNLRRVIVAAACVAALVAAITAALLITDRGSSSPVTPGTAMDTPTDPGNDEQPGFVIEDGTLLEYTGADTEIMIPETVSTISANAFTENANAQNVTAVFLGSSVENIEPLALSPLTSLKTVEVAEDNEYYEVAEGALLRKDGTYVLAPLGAHKTHDYDYNGFMTKLYENRLRIKEPAFFEIGNILIELRVKNEYLSDDPEDYYQRISAKSISAFGHTIELPDGSDEDDWVFITGNSVFQAFEVGDYAIVANSYYDIARTYVFSKDGCVFVDEPEYGIDESSGVTGISFYEKDGSLYYHRIPVKFNALIHQVDGGVLEYCTSRDELFRETGRAEMIDGKMVYYPEITETVSDVYDLDELYSRWQAEDPEYNSITLDEYLEENAKLYERAY